MVSLAVIVMRSHDLDGGSVWFSAGIGCPVGERAWLQRNKLETMLEYVTILDAVFSGKSELK
jgi:hypothetical protein